VLAGEVVARYVARIAASVTGMPAADPPDLAAAILPGLCWSDLVEPAGPWSAYRRDEDTFLDEAAVALALPPWAWISGAARAGERKVLVVVGEGHTLAELLAHLAA
jgi:hypothetical protein